MQRDEISRAKNDCTKVERINLTKLSRSVHRLYEVAPFVIHSNITCGDGSGITSRDTSVYALIFNIASICNCAQVVRERVSESESESRNFFRLNFERSLNERK